MARILRDVRRHWPNEKATVWTPPVGTTELRNVTVSTACGDTEGPDGGHGAGVGVSGAASPGESLAASLKSLLSQTARTLHSAGNSVQQLIIT